MKSIELHKKDFNETQSWQIQYSHHINQNYQNSFFLI